MIEILKINFPHFIYIFSIKFIHNLGSMWGRTIVVHNMSIMQVNFEEFCHADALIRPHSTLFRRYKKCDQSIDFGKQNFVRFGTIFLSISMIVDLFVTHSHRFVPYT